MTINKVVDNDKVTLQLEGFLDIESSEQLEGEIGKISGIQALIIDMDKLEYVSSSGLRQITAAYKKGKAENFDFQIINVGEDVMEVFTLTELDKKFNISAK